MPGDPLNITTKLIRDEVVCASLFFHIKMTVSKKKKNRLLLFKNFFYGEVNTLESKNKLTF
jgi:hypothetical protein